MDKLILIFLLCGFIIFPNSVMAFTEFECYINNSVIAAAPKCLKELKLLYPSFKEVEQLMKIYVAPCMQKYRDAGMTAWYFGRRDIRKTLTCREIINEYILFFNKIGLTGKLIQPIPDGIDDADNLMDNMIKDIK